VIDNEALKSIEKLHEMNAKGIISDDEFAETKQRILAAGKRSTSTSPLAKGPDATATLEEHLAWALLPFRRYAQFEGRSGRREFWMFYLLVVVVGGALFALALQDDNLYGEAPASAALAYLLLIVGILVTVIPYLAVQVRRLHDLGRSGWFALINIIPYIGPVALLVLMAMPGIEGENEYGPDLRF